MTFSVQFFTVSSFFVLNTSKYIGRSAHHPIAVEVCCLNNPVIILSFKTLNNHDFWFFGNTVAGNIRRIFYLETPAWKNNRVRGDFENSWKIRSVMYTSCCARRNVYLGAGGNVTKKASRTICFHHIDPNWIPFKIINRFDSKLYTRDSKRKTHEQVSLLYDTFCSGFVLFGVRYVCVTDET